MALPLGIVKLLVLGSIATGGLSAGYQAVKPSAPMTAQARYAQSVGQHKEYSKLTETQRRSLLRRGIDVDNYRKLTTTKGPSLLGRLAGKLPKPSRIPLRLR